MNVFLFTFHGYATWMPDHPDGFTRPRDGLLPPDASLSELYQAEQNEDRVAFDDAIQKLLIDELQIAGGKQRFRLLFVATENTHVHALVRWEDERPWLKVRTGIKASITKRLNHDFGRRTWLSERASRRHVTDDDHFIYLVHEYLPSHRGRKWSEAKGPFK